MTLHWFVTGASLIVALAACWQAWRLARRLDQLSQQYWELKYLNGELRVKLQRVTGDSRGDAAPGPRDPAETPRRESFVPLSSLKR